MLRASWTCRVDLAIHGFFSSLGSWYIEKYEKIVTQVHKKKSDMIQSVATDEYFYIMTTYRTHVETKSKV